VSEDAASLFSIAENLFQSNSYEHALKSYREFLDYYPSDSKADMALMRIATIYSNQEKFGLSLLTYRRLTLFRKGQFKEVILQASEIIEKTDAKAHLSRTYEVLGDTYMSLRSPKEAIFFYQMAGCAENEDISLKLKMATDQLSKEDMLSLSAKINDQFLAGYFHFELGFYQVQNQNYTEALSIFSEFLTNFPEHEKKREAQEWIEKINERLVFKRRLIGILLPLTGPYKVFGNRALRAIQFALDQFNDQSNQPAFKIIVRDTRSDPQTTIKAIRQFDKNHVSIIIGPIVMSEYAAREAQIRSIPIVTLSQKPEVPELGDYVFRFFLTPQMQIDTLVPFAINELGVKRFAVLYPEESYGDTFLKFFRDSVLDYGAKLVAVESYKPEQTDFASQIRKFSKSRESEKNGAPVPGRHSTRRRRHQKYKLVLDFDAIFIPDSADKIALIAPQLAFYDIDNVLLLGTNLWHSDNLIHSARNYVQEAIMTDAFYARDSKKNVQEFISGFEETHGESPGLIEALAYDTAMMNFHNLSNPGIRSRNDLKHAIKNISNFEGVTGYTSFNKNGDAIKNLYVLQIEENQFVQVNRK
jgi:ABC-type branched-subunit amino acid transport system substrate-binding protein